MKGDSIFDYDKLSISFKRLFLSVLTILLAIL